MHHFTRLSVYALASMIPLACTTKNTTQTQFTELAVSAAHPEKVDAYGHVVRMGTRSGSTVIITR